MAKLKRSPLAPATFPKMPAVSGVRLLALKARIKYAGRDDLLLAALDSGSTVAGVFTRSTTSSAPVQWSRAIARKGKARALLVNSGNANTFTGQQGHQDVKATAAMAARILGCRAAEVIVASTGVIGEPLPTGRIERALGRVTAKTRPASWLRAAKAIGTTDTYPKGSTRSAEIGGVPVTLCGIAKGSTTVPLAPAAPRRRNSTRQVWRDWMAIDPPKLPGRRTRGTESPQCLNRSRF